MNKHKSNKECIIVKNVKHFDPVHTFECGQCFRWNRLDNGRWFGVVKGAALELDWDGRNLALYNTTPVEFEGIWHPYFDLGRDYGEIKDKLAHNDPVMAEAIAFGHGIRLLRQDFGETLISFLVSQNNGIPRIKGILEALSKAYGELVPNAIRECYAFPTLEKISGLSLDELKVIRAGYRDKYLIRAAKQVFKNEVDLNLIRKGGLMEARLEMQKLFGVGEKVADCVLLFSGTRYDIFPVDRWVKRVMAELYLGYDASYEELFAFASEKFGELAGFAQQYLFYYAREKKIGM